jgi:3',5'-cyclic AMP phosphodiesterase CpdA
MIKKKYRKGLTMRLGGLQDEYRTDTGSSQGAYTTVIGQWCFIVLNGDDLSFTAPQDREQKNERNETVDDLYSNLRYNGLPWNGGIGKKQMKWLEEQLGSAQKAGRNVIVLCHFPLFSREDHLLFNWREVLALLSRYPCVKAYFNGHFHAGGYQEKEGIHFVNFKGMVDTERNAFGVVTLTSDSILIKGYGREVDRKLKLR